MNEYLKQIVSKPANVVLRELLEGRKTTLEQQMQVIEHRREILVRCKKTFSLKTLGHLSCLDSGNGFVHKLNKDKPEIVSSNNQFNLDSRGFFAGNSFTIEKNGKRLAFGVDDESWLLIKIDYSIEDRGLPSVYQKAMSVGIVRADLSTILGEMRCHPKVIWYYFKIITDEWVSHRNSLYNEALAVADGMEKEDTIFQLIT